MGIHRLVFRRLKTYKKNAVRFTLILAVGTIYVKINIKENVCS